MGAADGPVRTRWPTKLCVTFASKRYSWFASWHLRKSYDLTCLEMRGIVIEYFEKQLISFNGSVRGEQWIDQGKQPLRLCLAVLGHFLVPITDRLGGVSSGLQGILSGGEKNNLLIGATPDLQLSCLLCLLR